MAAKPVRVQLSRARGWKMPANTVKVDRTTKWGNPFKVGVYGTAQECVTAFNILLAGAIELGCDHPDIANQRAYHAVFLAYWRELVGKNLACWCRKGQPCHADSLLRAVQLMEREVRRGR